MSGKLTPAQREHIVEWIILWIGGHVTLYFFRGTMMSSGYHIIVYICVLSEYLTYDNASMPAHLRWIAWRGMRISRWGWLCLLIFGGQGLLVLVIRLSALHWWDTHPPETEHEQ